MISIAASQQEGLDGLSQFTLSPHVCVENMPLRLNENFHFYQGVRVKGNGVCALHF